MKSIAKYLKPFIFLVIVNIAFLFVRAYTDLSLPNLMSDIVNTGIQRSGIDEAAPDRISEQGMQLVNLFMVDSERETFTNAYALENGTYERIEFSDPAVGAAYGRATYAIVSFATEMAEQQGQELVEGSGSTSEFDINLIYQMLPALQQMPQGTLADYAGADDANMSMMYDQVGAAFTKLFYEELGMDVGKIQADYIWKTGGLMLAVTLAGVFAVIGGGYLSSKIGAGFARDLRRGIFAKVESFSSKEFDKFSTASLLTRTTNDVTQLQMVVIMGMRMLLYAPIMGVGGVFMALDKSLSLSWIIGVAVLVLIGGVVILFSLVVPKFTKLQELTDKLNLVSRDSLSGMLVIRAFGNEQHEEERFDKVNSDLTQTNRSLQRTIATMMPLMTIIMNVVTVAIIWVGAHAIANSTMLVGDMMAFMQYAMQIIMAFLMIAIMFIMIPRAAVSARRIGEVLNSELVIKESDTPVALDESRTTRTIQFNDVTFRYGRAQDPVLCNISFTAKPGETTAFIGATGSGKSSLVNLVPRFYDVSEGSVTIDGVDIRNLSMKELRDNIGYVPQKGLLFSGTVADNVKYGRIDAPDAAVEQAIDVAQARDFVAELEDGINAEIAQGGTNVSGGQRQRLAIARALVKQAPIYIFDDSFSALDFKTDAALRKALKKYTNDATVLIVAQRVSTIMQAEQIVVLDAGKIVGKGTHKELLESCPVYREIAESQLSKEEM